MLGSLLALTEGGKGCYQNLLKELLVKDTESFREFVRMNRNHFLLRNYETINARKTPK